MNKKVDLNLLRKEAEAQLIHEPAIDTVTHTSETLLRELQVHQIELEMQNEELRCAHVALEAAHDRYLQLYDFAPVAYLTLSKNELITEANLTCCALLGVERNKLLNSRFAHYVTPEDGDSWYLFFKQVKDKQQHELTLCRTDGTHFDAHIDCLHVKEDDRLEMLRIAIIDITEHKKAENILLETQKEVITLQQQLLAESEKESKEINIAFNVLLKNQQTDKHEIQCAVSDLANMTILPFLKKLQNLSANSHQADLLNMLETNLDQLIKTYGRANTLSSAYLLLTPVEIQVASMIKQGQSTKTIGKTLRIESNTVSTHRKHIRKKLNLDRTTNLYSYLMSLTD
jgi:PAS domain S-box-containing protein